MLCLTNLLLLLSKPKRGSDRMFKSKLKYFVRYWLPPILWAVLIFYMSSLSFPSGKPGIRLSDKLMHTIEFFILSFLLFRAFYNSRWKRAAYWFAILLTILYGTSDEIHQTFTPQRVFDIYDVLFNSFGASLVFVFSFINKKLVRAIMVPV